MSMVYKDESGEWHFMGDSPEMITGINNSKEYNFRLLPEQLSEDAVIVIRSNTVWDTAEQEKENAD